MSLNEQLASAGMLEAFDNAIAAHDRPAFAGILRSIGLNDEQVAETWEWVWHSPHSPHNVDPGSLADDLAFDRRVAALDDRGKRVVQHLFETAGGLGDERCRWRDCEAFAARGLAYCPYCAYALLGIRTVKTEA
jgi:hypothetical protein